jgi:hypothetical protein
MIDDIEVPGGKRSMNLVDDALSVSDKQNCAHAKTIAASHQLTAISRPMFSCLFVPYVFPPPSGS